MYLESTFSSSEQIPFFLVLFSLAVIFRPRAYSSKLSTPIHFLRPDEKLQNYLSESDVLCYHCLECDIAR